MEGRGRVRIVALEGVRRLEPFSLKLKYLKSFIESYMKRSKRTSLMATF